MENLIQFLDFSKSRFNGKVGLGENEFSVYYSNLNQNKNYCVTFGKKCKHAKQFIKVGYFANFIVFQFFDKMEKGCIKGHLSGKDKSCVTFTSKDLVEFVLNKFGEKVEDKTKKRFVYEYEKSGDYLIVKINN